MPLPVCKLICGVIAAAALVPTPAAGQFPTSSWLGGAGLWSDAHMWNPTMVPGPERGAVLTATGTPTLTGNVRIPTLTLNGNAGIDGTGNVTVFQRTTWSAGYLQAVGTLFADGGADLTLRTSVAPLVLRQNMVLGGSGSTLTNQTAAGYDFQIADGATLTNAVGSTFTVTPASPLNVGSTNTVTLGGTVANAGTLVKDGAPQLTISVPFQNTGTLDARQGVLRLAGGGTSSGAVVIAAGATLRLEGAGTSGLGGPYQFDGGVGVSGAGRVVFDTPRQTTSGLVNVVNAPFAPAVTAVEQSAEVHFNGGPYSLNAVEVAGVMGGAANVTVTGPLTWTRGELAGTGGPTTTAAGGATINLTASARLNGRTLRLTAPANTLSVAGASTSLIFEGGGRLEVAAGAMLSVDPAANMAFSSAAGSGSVANAGTFTKLGTTTLTVVVPVTNTGTFDVRAGTVALTGGMANTGTLTVATGATVTFSASSTTTTSGGRVAGSGRYTGPLVVTAGGTLAPGDGPTGLAALPVGATNLSGGGRLEFQLNGPTAGAGHDQVAVTGTVNVTGATLAATLGYAPAAGDRLFVLINDSTDPITGRFDGLPDGSVVTLGGYTATIHYAGDSATLALTGGNDVVLANFAPVPEPPLLVGVGVALLAVRRVTRSIPPRSSP